MNCALHTENESTYTNTLQTKQKWKTNTEWKRKIYFMLSKTTGAISQLIENNRTKVLNCFRSWRKAPFRKDLNFLYLHSIIS